MKIHALRLMPGQDLRQEISRYVKENHISAGCILSSVGSLKQAAIRFAGKQGPELLDGPFEIISLNGNVSLYGQHLHISMADTQGLVTGGHLCDGSTIYTTAELVIAELGAIPLRGRPTQKRATWSSW